MQQKKFRDEEGLFIAEGEKMVEEALKSGYQVECVYRKEEIGEEAMKRISALSTPSPVLAVIRKPADIHVSDLSAVLESMAEGGLYLALDSIRDPGNLGTILRIADWFGVDGVFAVHNGGYIPCENALCQSSGAFAISAFDGRESLWYFSGRAEHLCEAP